MGTEQRTAGPCEDVKLAKESRAGKGATGGSHLCLLNCSWLTWKRLVAGAGAAGPGASEPLGMVVHPPAGLLREIKVAVES